MTEADNNAVCVVAGSEACDQRGAHVAGGASEASGPAVDEWDALQIRLTMTALLGLRARILEALQHQVRPNGPRASALTNWLGCIDQVARKLRAAPNFMEEFANDG